MTKVLVIEMAKLSAMAIGGDDGDDDGDGGDGIHPKYLRNEYL